MSKRSGRLNLALLVVWSVVTSACGEAPVPGQGTRTSDLMGVWQDEVLEGTLTWRLELTDDHSFTRVLRSTALPAENVSTTGTWSSIEPPNPVGTWQERVGLAERPVGERTVSVTFEYWVPRDATIPLGAMIMEYRGGPRGLLAGTSTPVEMRLRETYTALVRPGGDGASASLRLTPRGMLPRLLDPSALREEGAPVAAQVPTELKRVP
ncbi:MAG: hypothetical protein ABL993_05325 [Vicinamibacterales bacterium]